MVQIKLANTHLAQLELDGKMSRRYHNKNSHRAPIGPHRKPSLKNGQTYEKVHPSLFPYPFSLLENITGFMKNFKPFSLSFYPSLRGLHCF